MYYLAAPLGIANGTLGCHGTPVGNHCSKEMASASNLHTANQIRVMTATKWPYCCTTQCFMVFKINHLVVTFALLLL